MIIKSEGSNGGKEESQVRPKYVRVFIARSDPALNYGLICAVILNKLALSKLKFLEMKKQVPIYPIIGVGSLPFRGHLSPSNIEGFLSEHKGVHTVTIQSALKYDHQLEEVKKVVGILNEKLPYGETALIGPHEEKVLLEVLNKFKSSYQGIIEDLAPLINSISSHIPRRRARKLHVGLFGYSRSVGSVSLPRAIPFTGTLYSLGIPPEIIGFEAMMELSEDEWNMLKRYYENIKVDLKVSASYLSWQNIDMLTHMHKEVARRAGMEGEKLRLTLSKLLKSFSIVEENFGIKLGPRSLDEKKHENITSNFLISYIEHNNGEMQKHLVEAAMIRRSLG
ncbi:MAG: phosphoenolpyruvate carboxylase [archaeon]|nr:phosphoenolpyruvate carboxylase [archaeon]